MSAFIFNFEDILWLVPLHSYPGCILNQYLWCIKLLYEIEKNKVNIFQKQPEQKYLALSLFNFFQKSFIGPQVLWSGFFSLETIKCRSRLSIWSLILEILTFGPSGGLSRVGSLGTLHLLKYYNWPPLFIVHSVERNLQIRTC